MPDYGENFAQPGLDLGAPSVGKLGVAAQPTGGQGLALNDTGKVEPKLLSTLDAAEADVLTVTDGVPAWTTLPEPALVKIEQLTSTSTSVDFQNIPQTYTHLRLQGIARQDNAAAQVGYIRFNNDSGANYRYQIHYGQGATTAASNAAAQVGGYTYIASSTSSANTATGVTIDIPFYAGTTFHKSFHSMNMLANSVDSMSLSATSLWANTAAITRVQIVLSAGNFVTGSTFALYGVS